MTRLLTTDPVVKAIDRENNRLIAENDALREQVRRLEEILLAPRAGIPLEWRLTRAEERLFCALVARQMLTREQILSALYWDRPDGHEPAESMVSVMVSKLRKKLPVDVQVRLSWGRGYYLDEATRARIRAAMLTPRAAHGRIGAT